MSDLHISVSGTKRLLTKGKLCDKNIVVTAEGGGVDDRYDEGYDDGKQAQYDAFWDAYQDNGKKTDYGYAFAGIGWTDETFKPKYDIRPVSAVHIFSLCRMTDIVKLLNDCGVVFDLSQCYGTGYFMQGNYYTQTLPTLDCRLRQNLNYFLYDCTQLRCVEKVILKDDGAHTFTAYSFGALPKLEEIIFEGCIGTNFLIAGSPLLTAASVQSIIDCLKDLTGATAQTLTLHATVVGNMTPEQKAAITAKNWTLVY